MSGVQLKQVLANRPLTVGFVPAVYRDTRDSRQSLNVFVKTEEDRITKHMLKLVGHGVVPIPP
eukprot:8761198-Pyramimonas_sp.AAC.1